MLNNETWGFRKLAIGIAVLWVAIFAAYSNSFSNSFQFDDTHTIQSNIFIRSLSHVPRYFVDPSTSSYRPENSGYRPMATLFSAMGFQISGAKTWGYHLLKITEHCLVATLIFLLGLQLLPTALPGVLNGLRTWIVYAAAMIFGVHRVHTEVVNYISAVSSLQAGLFYLAAFFVYTKAREQQGSQKQPTDSRKQRGLSARSLALVALSTFFFLCSVWSKEEGITLPAMILAYEWLYRKERNWKALLVRVLPFVVVAVFFVVARQQLMNPMADTSRGTGSPFLYFITQWRSWLYYWFLFFWPVHLNADNFNFDFRRVFPIGAFGHQWLCMQLCGRGPIVNERHIRFIFFLYCGFTLLCCLLPVCFNWWKP
jgi:uncharacterized membrane protein